MTLLNGVKLNIKHIQAATLGIHLHIRGISAKRLESNIKSKWKNGFHIKNKKRIATNDL